MQSKYTIGELEEELMEQIEKNCSGKIILAGHSWGAWLAGLFAERFADKVEKVILIGCGPLDEYYVSQIEERRKVNMSSEEAEEFDWILRQLENGFGEKDEYLQRLGEICDRADGYQEEEALRDEADVNGDLHEKVWKEAAGLRKSGKLLERFVRISCPPVQQPYWNTIYLDSFPGEELLNMIDHAYDTVLHSFSKKVQCSPFG